MDKLLETLHNLNYVVTAYMQFLLHDQCACTEAKRILTSELCVDVNSFVMLNIDPYLYVYPCTQAIDKLSKARNSEQVAAVCLDLIKWTAETIHELDEMEA